MEAELPKSLEPQVHDDPLMVQLYMYRPYTMPGASDVSDLGCWWWDKLEDQEMFQELATDHPNHNFFVVITTVTTDLTGLI